MRRFWFSVLALLLGVALHMAALAVAERTAPYFPTVPDLLLDRLPSVNLFAVGEAAFWLFFAVFAVAFLRLRPLPLPRVLLLLGVFYAVRGAFLLLLPLGPPSGALPSDGRFALYPYADHAYFPGGHVGIMLLFALHLPARTRRWFALAAVLFGIGTMLTKAHYTADTLGGLLLGYAVYTWGERNLGPGWSLGRQKPEPEGSGTGGVRERSP